MRVATWTDVWAEAVSTTTCHCKKMSTSIHATCTPRRRMRLMRATAVALPLANSSGRLPNARR
eukprot:9545347-Lingulodinium_polyedra.AAC.1